MTLGIDGETDFTLMARDGCCPQPLNTITMCSVICNVVSALPRGPIWDRSKAGIMGQASSACSIPVCAKDCFSIVSHAVYTGHRLWTMLHDALWPAIRESDPFTAYTTVDDWLRRLGWIDCFNSACRDKNLGFQTPLEVLIGGTPTYSPPPYSADLTLAVKLGIVHSLARLQMGIVPTIDAVNFVIAPLGAKVEALGLSCDPWPCREGCEPPDAGCIDTGPDVVVICDQSGRDQACGPDPECPEPDVAQPWSTVELIDPADPCCRRCDHPVWRICHSAPTLPRPVLLRADIDNEFGPNTATIPAFVTRQTTGETVWPGVLAAECIVRSLIPPGTYLEIQRC